MTFKLKFLNNHHYKMNSVEKSPWLEYFKITSCATERFLRCILTYFNKYSLQQSSTCSSSSVQIVSGNTKILVTN